jgi:hypothetical protein
MSLTPNSDFTLEINPDELRAIATEIESQTKGFVNFEDKVIFTHKPSTAKKRPIWPGNQINCSGENKRIHDYLCELLHQDGMNEHDVCMASVGIWGAIHVMNEKLAVTTRQVEILEAVNTDLQENLERQSGIIKIIDQENQAFRKAQKKE